MSSKRKRKEVTGERDEGHQKKRKIDRAEGVAEGSDEEAGHESNSVSFITSSVSMAQAPN
jgi:hypothetical protein